VLTDEETGQIIGARLRAEVADIATPDDLIRRIRRHDRRTTAVRGGVAIAGAAVLATAGLTLAAVSGPATPGPVSASTAPPANGTGSHPAGSLASPDHSIELDGYQVKLPSNLRVRKVGAGYLVGSRATGYFTIFLERGKNVGPKFAMAHGLTVHHVRVGLKSAWWVGTSHGGELWIQVRSLPASEFVVAKVLGASEEAALRFALGLAITHMPVVHVSCSASRGCG
jgi:hypothetical protein